MKDSLPPLTSVCLGGSIDDGLADPFSSEVDGGFARTAASLIPVASVAFASEAGPSEILSPLRLEREDSAALPLATETLLSAADFLSL